jgi:hypothetical protein
LHNTDPFYFERQLSGSEYKTDFYSGDGNQLLRRTENTWQMRENVSWLGYPYASKDPRLVESKNTLADTNQVSATSAIHPTNGTVGFDQYNNQTDVYEYDYGNNGSLGALKRHTHTDFVTDANYVNNFLRSLPSQTWISSDADGQNIVSKSLIEYDNYLTDPLFLRTNVIGHDTANYGTDRTIRGNVTKVTTYSDVNNTNTDISVKSQYDILGNVVKTIDAKGNENTIIYNDNFGSPDNNVQTTTQPTH